MNTNLLGVVFIAATLTNWVRNEFKEMKCDECPGPPYWHRVVEHYEVVPDRRVNVMENGVVTEIEFCDTTGTPLILTNWVQHDIKDYVPTIVRAQSNALHTIHGPTNTIFYATNGWFLHQYTPVFSVTTNPLFVPIPTRP